MEFMILLLPFILLFGLYMLVRNEAVYSYRVNFLQSQGVNEYLKLPDYDTMMLKFWVWPLSSFKRD